MWKKLSEEQRHSYGEDYFEAALRSLEKYIDAVRVLKNFFFENSLKMFFFSLLTLHQ